MKFKLDKCLFVVSMNTLRPGVAKGSTRSTGVEIQHGDGIVNALHFKVQ
jgi:hypothetical protein